jgi:hypothetical protein
VCVKTVKTFCIPFYKQTNHNKQSIKQAIHLFINKTERKQTKMNEEIHSIERVLQLLMSSSSSTTPSVDDNRDNVNVPVSAFNNNTNHYQNDDNLTGHETRPTPPNTTNRLALEALAVVLQHARNIDS